MKTIIEEAVDNIDRMTELLHRQIETYRELQKALLIADLLGVPPNEIKNPIRSNVCGGGRVAQRPWIGAVLTVRVGDGPYEDFALIDVDNRLWPDDMRRAFDTWCKRYPASREAKQRRTNP